MNRQCEEFYQWLNEYEDSKFSQDEEKIQVQLVERLFESEKAEVLELYKVFEPYFKEYVTKNKG